MRKALAKNVVWWLVGASACTLGVLSSGCQARGIGDPCIPEAIPTSGFTSSEAYVETSSVQCRTRVCLVYRLAGNPEQITGTDSCPAGSETCVPQAEVDERVFCSCRCSASGGDTNLPLCDCTEGFHCVDLLTQGGAGVRGGYCIREDQCETNDDCGAGQTCSSTENVCVNS